MSIESNIILFPDRRSLSSVTKAGARKDGGITLAIVVIGAVWVAFAVLITVVVY